MLSETARDFILHWGEMGTRWGVNRSVAQVHALLFLAEQPLPADTIVEQLGLARSNVSTSLKELQAWQLVQVRHVMGDRREHFVAVTDIAEVFRLIVDGRKQREIDPTLQALRRFASAAEAGHETLVHARIAGVLEFVTMLDQWYATLQGGPGTGPIDYLRMAQEAHRLLKRRD